MLPMIASISVKRVFASILVRLGACGDDIDKKLSIFAAP